MYIRVVNKYIVECISGTILGVGETNSSAHKTVRVPLFMEHLELGETLNKYMNKALSGSD